ncbi:BspA family leucine-rich repeat surface protein [Tunicatimonas pelagia]|uniref:BspA family leucine-rich repeat surface protein n=1 Tax=Tunicatimonas pelagia TaxID=931531 RepID=UPI002664F56A|nr:BspA family leucine-rich repeat surface protein [Tunicatimonas pelagia]WKN43121.1 BspA family leucine-rich repeat surface protein [Tunicatimonas pelagia]
MKKLRPQFFVLIFLLTVGLFSCKDDESPASIEVVISAFSETIAENPTVGTSLGNLSATTNQGTLIYSLSNQNPTGALAVDSLTGELTVANASLFDFETNQTLTATSTASVGTVSQPSTVTITLTDVDESVDAVSVADFALTLDENPISGQLLGQVATTSASGTVSFALASQTPAGAMAINSSTGELSVADSIQFDYETNPTLSAQVVATVGTASDTAQVTIILNDVDESTVTADDLAVTINENPSNGQSLGKINTTNASGAVTFSFAAQNPAGTFALNDSTGELTVADSAKFDFETNPTLTAQIIATVGTATDTAQVTITLNDVDETMITISNFSVTMDENPTSGQSLGTITTTNASGAVTFSFTAQNPTGAFALNDSTGELTVADSAKFDFETNPTLTAQVIATVGTAADTAQVTITLTNLVETVTARDFIATIDENPASGLSMGTVSVDTDAANINYSLVTGNLQVGETPAAFSISTAGELTVADASLYDFETRQTVTARYLTSNADGSLQDEGSITITLNDVAEAGPDAFILTYRTTRSNESVNIATIPGLTYDFNVNWGDGRIDNNLDGIGTIIHIYSRPGDYKVTITGTYPAFNSGSPANASKLISVDQWGTNVWQSMEFMFNNCANLISVGSDSPDLSAVTSLRSMFNRATSFNSDISHWDVSTIVNMSAMFGVASSFNQDISSWDVSNVTDMSYMFSGADSFDQPLNSWANKLTNVVTMAGMFDSALSFSQDISSWDVSNVADMSLMFYLAVGFNQPLDNWDVSNVTNMSYMFSGADFFNQPLNSWANKLTNVVSLVGMFDSALRFNQDISGWDVSSVTDMQLMFSRASAFNQDISGWDVQNVTSCSQFSSNSALIPAFTPGFTNCSQ